MPNPFPGMNPYFENPNRWGGFHNQFIAYLSGQLNDRLPDEFAANVEERLYLVQDKRNIVADFAVARRIPIQQTVSAGPQQSSGGVAVLEREPQTEPQRDAPRILQIEPIEVRERFIEIVAVGDGQEREVVAVIEVLSPTNKMGQGREKYQRKQQELLQTTVHFLEIDLLRGGTHTVDLPLDGLLWEISWDYLVVLHRAERRGSSVEYWPVPLNARLPRVSVPLTPGVPDVPIDLQDVLNTVYDRGAYAKLLDYDENPIPPLSVAQAAWVDALLREKGLRR